MDTFSLKSVSVFEKKGSKIKKGSARGLRMGCKALARLVTETAAVTILLLELIAAEANDEVDLSFFSLAVILGLAMMLLRSLDDIERVVAATLDPDRPLLAEE